MLLVLTNSKDATANFFCQKITEWDIPYFRLDTDTASEQFRVSYPKNTPSLIGATREFQPNDFENIWFRRPTPIKVSHGADTAENRHIAGEWSEAFEGFLAHIPTDDWINHPALNVIASHKLEQLTRAKQFGLDTPDTLLTQEPDDVLKFWRKHGQQIIVKPLATGYLERDEQSSDSIIYTSLVLEKHISDLSQIPNCPTLFQERINKRTDVRVTIIDGQYIAIALNAAEDGEQRLDIRRNNMRDVSYEKLHLPDAVSSALLKLVQSYSLRFAAVDLCVDSEGMWKFFEINPNGQWAWLDIYANAGISSQFAHAITPHAI